MIFYIQVIGKLFLQIYFFDSLPQFAIISHFGVNFIYLTGMQIQNNSNHFLLTDSGYNEQALAAFLNLRQAAEL